MVEKNLFTIAWKTLKDLEINLIINVQNLYKENVNKLLKDKKVDLNKWKDIFWS